MSRHSYDREQDPPAPVVPVRVRGLTGELGVVLPGLIDSGADCTLIPASLARELRLPQVDHLSFSGVGGQVLRAPVFAARLQLGGWSSLARVTAFGDELIVGRDLLNRAVLQLDGPRLELTLHWSKPGRHRR